MTICLTVVLAWLACSGSPCAADEKTEKKDDPPKAEQKDDAKKDDGKEEAEDPYKLPETGGVKELLGFMKELLLRRTRLKTREDLIAYQTMAQAALRVAAEKIQRIATDDDKKLPGYDDAMAFNMVLRGSSARDGSPEEVKQLVDDIKAAFAAGETSPEQPAFFLNSKAQYLVSAATQLGMTLEYNRHAELKDLAIGVYRDLGALLAGNKDPKVAATGAKMVGAARRLDLLGNPLEISGTEMDGAKFDWAKYRGKVVLVDFWATWCGPCMAELPNVKKHYELYHDRGFDVVGISVDRDRAKLESFLDKEQNPWTTLHDGDWSDNAVATYYGVMGIPTVILVDKDGKVVSTNARGPELAKQLAALLGPPNPAETEAPENDAKK
jgi:thiol-disulfide isomerase/thioredoxin